MGLGVTSMPYKKLIYLYTARREKMDKLVRQGKVTKDRKIALQGAIDEIDTFLVVLQEYQAHRFKLQQRLKSPAGELDRTLLANT